MQQKEKLKSIPCQIVWGELSKPSQIHEVRHPSQSLKKPWLMVMFSPLHRVNKRTQCQLGFHSHILFEFVTSSLLIIDFFFFNMINMSHIKEICCSHLLKGWKTPLKYLNVPATFKCRAKELTAFNCRGVFDS